nr:MAG TPA: 4Fe-4S single cluster domain protein [Caudoviricetes sp.]
MNVSGVNYCDTANGNGCRVSVFVSGCSLHCKGCHNKEAWDPNYGILWDGHTLHRVLSALAGPYMSGLSVLGGEPFEDYNRVQVGILCAAVKGMYPSKDVWLWTGHTYDQVKYFSHVLDYVDVLITGPFIERKKCNGRYYGSSNQQIYRKSATGTFEIVQADALSSED